MLDFISYCKQTIIQYKKQLLTFALIPVFIFRSSLSVFAAGELFSSYETWVESPDQNSSSWVSGTSSTNGNVSISIDIIVSSESVTFVGSGSIGYNAGLFVSSFYVHQGDLITFDYINNLSSSSNNGSLRYGLKSSYSPDGLLAYSPESLGSDILESIHIFNISGTQKIEFTASEDGYFYLFCYTNSGWPANYTVSGLTVNGVSVKNEIVEVIEKQTDTIMNAGSEFSGTTSGILSSNDELSGFIDDYTEIEQSMYDKFTENQSAVIGNFSGFSWGSLSTAVDWTSDYLNRIYDNSGDFRTMFMYPILAGIALIFIGRQGLTAYVRSRREK